MNIPLDPSSRIVPSSSFSHLHENNTPETVAREFESILLAYVLKVMRESALSESSEGGFGHEIFGGMMDQELARGMVQKGGIGLSELILQELKGDLKSSPAPSEPAPSPATAPDRSAIPPAADSSRKASDDLLFRVSSQMGWREDPFTGERRFHRGVDLAAPEGTPVNALGEGTVIFAGWQKGYGNTVVIKNDEGVVTRYAHLSAVSVSNGEEVSSSQKIGKVGSTGRATGPHLHVEMEQKGRLLDPLEAEQLAARVAQRSGT